MGDGTVWHDALTVTWAGAKDVALEKSRDLYEGRTVKISNYSYLG